MLCSPAAHPAVAKVRREGELPGILEPVPCDRPMPCLKRTRRNCRRLSVGEQELCLSHGPPVSIILPTSQYATAKKKGCAFRERVLEYSFHFTYLPGAMNEQDSLCNCDGIGKH